MKIKLSDHFTYKRLIKFVAPSIFMMVFISIYGVIDGLFISRCVGKTAFASINLIMPFIMVLGGMGFMIGTGGTALVAKVLGEGDKRKANKYFTMLVMFTFILGAVLTVLGIIFLRPISYFLGASDEMIGDCVSYGRIVIGFTVTFMLQNLFQNFLVVAEKPNIGLASTVAAGCTNIVLDALFVAVFDWGVVGAAFATGISQCVGAAIPFVYFLIPNKSLLRLTATGIEILPIIKSCTNGISELMSNISASIVSMLYNFRLMDMLGEDGVSAYGVLMYVQFIFIAIFIGYVIGVSPVIGYNYGSSNSDELKNIFKKSIIIVCVVGVILTIMALSFSGLLARIFVGYSPELFELTKHAFFIFSFSFLIAGINIFASSLFTSLNNGLISAVISFSRTLVAQVAAILILPNIFGTDGIWYSTVVAELLALIVSSAFIVFCAKRYRYM